MLNLPGLTFACKKYINEFNLLNMFQKRQIKETYWKKIVKKSYN